MMLPKPFTPLNIVRKIGDTFLQDQFRHPCTQATMTKKKESQSIKKKTGCKSITCRELQKSPALITPTDTKTILTNIPFQFSHPVNYRSSPVLTHYGSGLQTELYVTIIRYQSLGLLGSQENLRFIRLYLGKATH